MTPLSYATNPTLYILQIFPSFHFGWESTYVWLVTLAVKACQDIFTYAVVLLYKVGSYEKRLFNTATESSPLTRPSGTAYKMYLAVELRLVSIIL